MKKDTEGLRQVSCVAALLQPTAHLQSFFSLALVEAMHQDSLICGLNLCGLQTSMYVRSS